MLGQGLHGEGGVGCRGVVECEMSSIGGVVRDMRARGKRGGGGGQGHGEKQQVCKP